jgi:excisionase family DNA binding protein
MNEFTFEALPQAVASLADEVGEIKRLLLEKSKQETATPDRWFDLTELCQYHPDKPTKATVYGWVNSGLIPVHKGGKKLRFLKSEIDEWLKQGRRKTVAEVAKEADYYLNHKKKGGSHV